MCKINPFTIIDHCADYTNIPIIPIFENKLSCIPLLTIAIPTYKRVDYLKETIESALNQNPAFLYEIIVVDNNPERSDETELLMAGYKNVVGISYYKNAQNIGMIGNWNRLFELSRTEWVTMLHDDDMLSPIYLQVFLRFLYKYPQLAIYQTEKTKNKGSICQTFKNIKPAKITTKDLAFYFKGGAPTGSTFNRAKLLELGGFAQDLYPSSDYALFTLTSLRYPIIYIPLKLTFYRWGGNESLNPNTRHRMIEKDVIIQKATFEEINFRPKLFVERFLSAMISVRNKRGLISHPDFKPVDPTHFKLRFSSPFWDLLYKIFMRLIL